MGRIQADEMANRTDLDTGLRWHLQGNHYPPIHTDFIPAAKRAIQIAGEAENEFEVGNEDKCRRLYDTEIELPNGNVLTVHKIIKGMHLEPWVVQWDEKENENEV